MSNLAPLVAVVGSTGVGKSRLSIELASAVRDGLLQLNTPWSSSKIINADAMQAYKGLNLVTNKVTKSEMNGIEHTLFDFRDITNEYIVTEWVTDAISEIKSAHESNQLPVTVGGTSYWLQHLIFTNRLASLAEDAAAGTPPPQINTSVLIDDLDPPYRAMLDSLPSRIDDVDEDTAFELHALLSKLDPAMAARWHWRDTRKVLRSLNIIRESNTTVEETYGIQLDSVARYPALIFWLYREQDELNPALDSRIDQMVQSGLKEEIEQMKEATSMLGGKTQMSGLNQAIGFKEFDAYFEDPSRPQVEFDHGIERMKVATRQYATRQVKWIKNRLLPMVISSQSVHIVLLELKDVAHWNEDILKPALECLTEFLNGHTEKINIPSRLLQSFIQQTRTPSALYSHASEKRKVRCDVCTVDPRKPVMLEEKSEWDAHRKSRSHRRKESCEYRKEQQLQKQEEVRLQRATARADVASNSPLVGINE
ncbi:tRNA isopentenyltransferase [Ceratobasidium sp. AG-I]|nr:tRNA isopentenyltransferase [Ceratobasidium sp. AG-I]